MKKILTALSVLLLIISNAEATSIGTSVAQQKQKQIKSVVVDKNGEPVIGANVVESGTTNGTITNIDGEFNLTVTEGANLIISYIGFIEKVVSSSNPNLAQIILEENAELLEEVIVVGYGTMKKSDLTGSVQRINPTQYETQSHTNLLSMLSGTVAGFISNRGTTAEGEGTMELRGPTSLKASNEPLIVLDGVIFQGSIQDISPSDIESIDILKDASSAAVFGARSASGVVIITTKKGIEGKPMVNFSTKIGVTGVTKHLKPSSPEAYMTAKKDYRNRMDPNAPSHYYTNPNELPSNISVQDWLNYDATNSGDATVTWLNRLNVSQVEQRNYLNGITTDWYDDIYRNGLRQDYNISVSGGTSNVSYFWSGSYVKNQGITVGDDYEAFRSRLNLSATVNKFLKLGLNAQFTNRDKSNYAIPLQSAVRMSPYTTRYDEDGKDIMYPNEDTLVENPFLYYQYRDKLDKAQSLFATITADITLPYGFSYQLAFANRFSWEKDYYFDSVSTPNGLSNSGYGSRMNTSIYDYSLDNILKWNKTYANIHKFDFTFLVNMEKYQSWSDTQTNSKFSPSDVLSYHALQGGTNPNIKNEDEYSTANAIMARLNYNLMNKYLLTLSYRRDGYSAFGLNNPYSNFTSAALGWNISEEKFFKNDFFDQLKLRLSWGTNGNREIGRYEALARLATIKYLYGNDISIGVYTNTMANQDLKWERTEAFNLGVDFSVFSNKLYGSIDYYDMTTNDLLLDRSLPIIIGYSTVSSNLGQLKNKGLELTLNSVNIDNSKIKWNSSFILSLNRNKITKLYGDMVDILDANGKVIGQREADDPTNSWFIGKSIDRIWDYEVLGIYQLDEAEEAAKYGKEPGDIKLRDVNGDGELTTEDKVFQGYKTPRFRLGLRNDIRFLKDFELSFFIRADLGVYGENNMYKNSTAGGQFERTNWYNFSYWTPENGEKKWARLSSNSSAPTFTMYENCSFVRLQDISLSYNFPRKITEKLNLGNLRVFVNANNLVTISGWSFWDPESLSEPMPKTFTFGLSLSM